MCNFRNEVAPFLFCGKRANRTDNSELDIPYRSQKIEGHGTLVDSAITFGRQHMHDRQSPKDLVSGEHPEAAGLCPDAAQRETTNNFIRPVDGASAAGNFDPSTEMCMETEGPR
jgi:hypothetical protein